MSVLILLSKTKYASQLAISTQILQERKANFEALHDFHMYIAESANRVFQKRSESWKQGICRKVHGVSTEDFYDELVKEPLVSFCVQMQPEILDACPCTSVFAEKFITWFNKLKWPDVQKTNHDTRRCSLLELYADFVLSANTLAPAQLIPKSQRPPGFKSCYKLRDLDLAACLAGKSLSAQSRVWTRAFRWFLKNSTAGNFLQLSRFANLTRVGYVLPHEGIQLRPQFVSGAQVYVLLHGFFNAGGATRKNLKRDFCISLCGG